MITNMLRKIEVGKEYRTYGGWKAKVIWKCVEPWQLYYYVIHKPGELYDESAPIMHDAYGYVHTNLSVNEPPTYTAEHPAQLKEEWRD